MRVLGFVLVMLGALTLGYHGFNSVGRDNAGREAARGTGATRQVPPIPPTVCGIILVTGLIVLVSSGRRGETI